MGVTWPAFGSSWAVPGVSVALLGRLLTASWAFLSVSWALLGASWLPNAAQEGPRLDFGGFQERSGSASEVPGAYFSRGFCHFVRAWERGSFWRMFCMCSAAPRAYLRLQFTKEGSRSNLVRFNGTSSHNVFIDAVTALFINLRFLLFLSGAAVCAQHMEF